MYLFELVFSVSLGNYSIVVLLGRMVFLFLISWGTSILTPFAALTVNQVPAKPAEPCLCHGAWKTTHQWIIASTEMQAEWVFCVLIFLFLRFIFCLQTPSSLSVTSAVENRVVLIKPVSFENNSTIWSSDDDWKIKPSAVAQLSLFHHF